MRWRNAAKRDALIGLYVFYVLRGSLYSRKAYMFNQWFSPDVLLKEQQRVDAANGGFDDVAEHLEGLDLNADDDEMDNLADAVQQTMRVSDGNYLYQNKPVWKRPGFNDPPWDTATQDFIFQHIDTTQGVHEKGEPGIHLWGCTEDGKAVAVIIKSFRPYFYARINNEQDARFVRERVELLLNSVAPWKEKKRHVESMERVYKRSFCGWSENKPLEPMYKFIMADCSGISKARKAMDYANRYVVPRDVPIQTFEANVPFEMRYMVDRSMNGCQWVRLRAGRFKQTTGLHKLTHAAYEFTADPADAIECIPLREKDTVAPMRTLYFDIECKKPKLANGQRSDGFVRPEEDPIVCICMCLKEEGRGVVHMAMMCFVERATQGVKMHQVEEGKMKPDIFTFNYEHEMLLAFRQYVVEADPDAFSGWNIDRFDLPYVFKRAIALRVDKQFNSITRMIAKKARIRERIIQSKAWGAKKEAELICEGRFVYDGLAFMERGQLTKYREYGLNAISKEVLGDQKVEVDYTEIGPLHEGSDEDRGRLAYYCLKDAELAMRILDNRMAFINGIGQARATGVPLRWIMSGQGRKTFSNLLRFKRPDEVVPSRSPKVNNVHTVGGYVRKPIVGYYTTPIVTQDFASLYPSVMQAENICYCTVLPAARAKELIAQGICIAPPDAPQEYQRPCTRDDFNWPPGFEDEFCFVKPYIRLGVLPDALTKLLAERAYVRGLIKGLDKVKNKDQIDVYENLQLAYKLCCNSVYGFLKAFILVDPRLMSAVTAFGQFMIKKTADIVLTHYKDNMIVNRKECERLGLDWERVYAEGEFDPRPRMPYTPRIIYGDTAKRCFRVLLF